MRLKENGIVYKIYKLTLLDRDHHRLIQTDFCHLMWSLIAAPFMGIVFVGIVVIIGPFVLIEEAIADRKRRRKTVYRGPSILKLWWDTIHGKLCPIVRFE